MWNSSYDTYEAAKRACDNDYNCQFITDEGCDGNGPFFLCSLMAQLFEHVNRPACTYRKRKWSILV